MSGFGDYEPEDGWFPDDPVPQLIANLFARLKLVRQARDVGHPRVRRRLADLAADLDHVRVRIEQEY